MESVTEMCLGLKIMLWMRHNLKQEYYMTVFYNLTQLHMQHGHIKYTH